MIIADVNDAKAALEGLTPDQRDTVAKLLEMALDSDWGCPLDYDELTEVATWLREG